MSELTSAVGAASGDQRLVEALRERYRRFQETSSTDLGRSAGLGLAEFLRPFELRLDRTSWSIGEGGEPAFTLAVRGEPGRRALEALDELSVSEAYMNGDLDIEGDMLAAIAARPILGDRRPWSYLWQTHLQPLLRGQVKSDKRWIASHYDVDPEFFLLWLDSRIRGYSHGFFESDDESLEDGMERKFRYAFDACGIQPGWRVLDIGGGWGSFLQFAAEQGVRVTSITISDASERTMTDLIARHGWEGCQVVKEHFLAYRPKHRFDAIVNLGVTEHLPDYRRTLAQYHSMLEPGRRVYLDAYSGPKHSMPSFISKWVFEGNTSPLNLEEYLTEVAETPFELVAIKNDRHNYFLSCKKWAENLEANRDEVVARWGGHLYRRFRLYLWAAASSFQRGTLSAHRMILQLPSRDGARRAAVESWNGA